jgi:hypothetical protein
MTKRRLSRIVGEALPRSTPGSEAIASLDDAIAGFVDLDVKGLCLQWRNHLGGLPPAHLPRWLLLRIFVPRQICIDAPPKAKILKSSAGRPNRPQSRPLGWLLHPLIRGAIRGCRALQGSASRGCPWCRAWLESIGRTSIGGACMKSVGIREPKATIVDLTQGGRLGRAPGEPP